MASELRPLLLTPSRSPRFRCPSPAPAEQAVGVAAAVNPDAFSQGTEVKIGNSILHNQRINTHREPASCRCCSSTARPSPSVPAPTIDKFVYDPSKNKGGDGGHLGQRACCASSA